MKSHQTRMDVIGNNIANVNTYGYKSQRAVFSDIFYQTLRSATAGTANRGGQNPSTVGYGSTLAGVQSQMTQSSMQSTGYGLDVAITGEGFIQVLDSNGNIYYTKAGLLDYDSNGYLTDINGNFVLGAASADGAADSQKIKLTNIGAVPASKSTGTLTLHGVNYTLSTSNTTKTGNIAVSFSSSASLPAGQRIEASISTTGAVNLQLNAYETFTSVDDLNTAINKAIKEANGGNTPTYGTLQLAADKDVFGTGLTGAEIVGTNFSVVPGTMTGDTDQMFNGTMEFTTTSSDFTGAGTVADANFKASYTAAGDWQIDLVSGGKTYTATVTSSTQATSLLLKSTAGDYIQVTNPGYSVLTKYYQDQNGGASPVAGTSTVNAMPSGKTVTLKAAEPSKELGFSSKNFSLLGGTEGGPVTLDQLTGISISSDGSITVTHPEKGEVVVGRISLANFANTSGLQTEGSGYYSATVNSGAAILSDPGSNGTGQLKSSSLEMSNVDLASEFADMITTQRGYQANARIITVSDTMLEELINLKR